MKKTEYRYKHFFEPVYKVNFYYAISADQNKFIEAVQKHYNICLDIDPQAEGQTIIYDNNKQALYLIWLKDQNDIPTFVHEAFHAIIAVFGQIRHDITFISSEPAAYLIGYLLEEYLRDNWLTIPITHKKKKKGNG